MRVALLSANAFQADAIGNQLADKVSFFLDHGAEIRVFLQSEQRLHPVVRPYVQCVTGTLLPDDACQFLRTADLVLADYSQFYPLLDLLPLLAGTRARVVLDYHGITPPALWPAQNREPLAKALQQRGLVWFADMAIAHSRFTCQELLQSTGYPAERLAQLGYAIDTDFFTPGEPTRPLRQRLGLEQATLLLFVGRLAPNKRVPLLVDALARLRDRQPPVHAVVIGDDADLYRREADRCRTQAAELGVADRLHVLGQVSLEDLRDAYRSADVLVMPSVHEGFCLPVLEAMACGLPVVAARTSALPETVASAGLTFAPEDAADLTSQLVRVLEGPRPPAASQGEPFRVAVVACRYGPNIVGGAETSLRTIAETLHEAGHRVEVFTTCCTSEDDWSDQEPEGTTTLNGLPVHRFRVQAHDPERYQLAQQRLAQAGLKVARAIEQDFLEHSLRSAALVEALRQRIASLDAVIVGPYLFGLTFDIARAFPDKTLLLPCFHDEPAARLPSLRAAYSRVGGILYHSPEEQALAESELGLNHPGAVCCGTCLDTEAGYSPAPPPGGRTGRDRFASTRYLLYCGRFSPHKNLPLLLDYARRYAALHPERFTFVFVGQGSVSIPAEPWARNLGRVEEKTRRDLVAGAAALVQLSCLESLSLVALEAWAQGVPVIAHRDCAVLAGQLQRCGGGRSVASFEEFAAVLDDLWERPADWQERGRRGQAYVREHYGCRPAFVQRLEEALRAMPSPLAERMRRQGLQRVQAHSRAAWRRNLGRIIEQVLDAEPRPIRENVQILPRLPEQSATVGLATITVPVCIHNQGSHPLLAEGPARTVLRCRVLDAAGKPLDLPARDTALPGMVLPGQTVPAALLVPVPQQVGNYQLACWAERDSQDGQPAARMPTMRLVVQLPQTRPGAALLWQSVQTLLEPARQLQELPHDYEDVSEGWLAAWKRQIKHKLLNNFRRAYVDVAFRQQSDFNRHILTILQELVDFWAVWEHAQSIAARNDPSVPSSAFVAELVEEVATLRQQCARLQERLARIETLLREKEEVRS